MCALRRKGRNKVYEGAPCRYTLYMSSDSSIKVNQPDVLSFICLHNTDDDVVVSKLSCVTYSDETVSIVLVLYMTRDMIPYIAKCMRINPSCIHFKSTRRAYARVSDIEQCLNVIDYVYYNDIVSDEYISMMRESLGCKPIRSSIVSDMLN